MTGFSSSAAAVGVGAVAATTILNPDTMYIALFGGFGGLSRWLYFALRGDMERWYKVFGHVLLSVLFVSGVFPIAPMLFGMIFGDGKLVETISVDPDAKLGMAYFIGMFTTLIIGMVEGRIKGKSGVRADV